VLRGNGSGLTPPPKSNRQSVVRNLKNLNMSDLTRIEKIKLEKFFEMRGGYVMDFSNRTFSDLVYEVTKINIYADRYEYGSGSKANRLRAFWDKENNNTVGKLTLAMLDNWRTERLLNYREISKPEQDLFDECHNVALRLKQETIVEEIEVIRENTDDKDFSLLAKTIRESIEKNEPESALDRLHTYVIKFIRQLCDSHGIEIKKDESLNAIFGKYVKFIVSAGEIESLMTERILKYSIHVIEAFNDIRNNKSFAHDNPILNYNESILIFNSVTNSIKFIEKIEDNLKDKKKLDEKHQENNAVDWDSIMF
jgi:hypothetical protein